MKAWILDRAGDPLRCAEVAEPAVRGGGAVISVLAAHIPSYTAAVIDGTLAYGLPTPLVLGPACVGRVEAVADDVFGVEPGDIVVNSSLLSSGEVDRAPDEILVGWTGASWQNTPTERAERMQSVWRDGVFAQRALCPKETLVRLAGADQYQEVGKLAVIPWLVIAAEGLLRTELGTGQTVVIAGATGRLGVSATLVALASGASRVIAVGRNRDSLERLAGLDRRVTTVALSGPRDTDAESVLAATDGDGAHAVLDVLGATPDPNPTLACFDALRPGGTMVLVGGVRHDLPLPYRQIMRRRLTVRGSWMATATTVDSIWRQLRSGVIDLSPISVHPVGLDDPAAAIKQAEAGSGFDFVALMPNG